MRMSKPSENPSGQPIGGQWANQQKQGMQKQEQAGAPASHPQLSDEEQKKLEQEVVASSEQDEGKGTKESPALNPEKQDGTAGP
jgi:hypothetical protein